MQKTVQRKRRGRESDRPTQQTGQGNSASRTVGCAVLAEASLGDVRLAGGPVAKQLRLLGLLNLADLRFCVVKNTLMYTGC